MFTQLPIKSTKTTTAYLYLVHDKNIKYKSDSEQVEKSCLVYKNLKNENLNKCSDMSKAYKITLAYSAHILFL